MQNEGAIRVMKKLFLIFLVISQLSSCGKKGAKNDPIYLPDPSLKKDNRTVREGSTVFLGDSLTEYAVWQDVFGKKELINSVELNTKSLNPILSDSSTGIDTANLGVACDTTQKLLLRLEEAYKHKPKKIFLLIGINDITLGFDLAGLAERHRQIIHTIRTESPNTILYVESIFPVGKDIREHFESMPVTFKDDIIKANQTLQKISEEENAHFLNPYEVMNDGRGYLRKEYTVDETHLTELGYSVWFNYLRPYVME